ncbi:glycosyltransferase family 1 protein [Aphanothece hegewaldii CCALA 016]|uniref:Glycosyltransferase family 1 protein n=1 Tax=Aphanothece hegewaldii CCALA 016 TaxID=2107694 RepID=A0A2T1LUP6_9CHRO|nr:glycosyltransferase [Aphanothece hegewaldii]PSF35290.1 glycosyltransferase family 1 protein [Aphanothece hegewaldii CCALA 016]
MKIAIISSGFLPVVDGVTVTQLYRLQKLSEYGHQVILFCPDYSSLATVYPNWKDYTGQIYSGVKIINLPSTPFAGLDFERNVSQSSYKIVLDELEKFRPDVIHIDEPERLWLGFFKVPSIDYAKRIGTPCISFFHTNFVEYLEDYLPLPFPLISGLQFIMKRHRRSIYNSYDATLVSSRVTADQLVKTGVKNIRYGQFLGIDQKGFSAVVKDLNFFENKYNLSGLSKKTKLIFLGRLTPDKNWTFTLDALSKFAENIDFDKLALIIAGDGELKEEISTKLNQLTPNVYFLGRIHPNDIPELLVNSDIHVTTSEKETTGLTVLEAFAAGIPVIAPRAGGFIDNVKNNETGFLYNRGDAEDFVKKLNLLIENKALREEMAKKSKESVIDFSWEKAVKNLLKVWEGEITKKLNK